MLQRTLQRLTFKPHAKESPRCEVSHTLTGGYCEKPGTQRTIDGLLCEGEGVMTRQDIKIPHHYTHERLGTMIGANREAVTRAFSKLQDEGGVELRRRLIHVRDMEALRRAAGYPYPQDMNP